MWYILNLTIYLTYTFKISLQFPITALREIKILQLLKHENVVNLIEICRTRGKYICSNKKARTLEIQRQTKKNMANKSLAQAKVRNYILQIIKYIKNIVCFGSTLSKAWDEIFRLSFCMVLYVFESILLRMAQNWAERFYIFHYL